MTLLLVPPLMDIFGRYALEPSGTMCTIDFWHGNFRHHKSIHMQQLFILKVLVTFINIFENLPSD